MSDVIHYSSICQRSFTLCSLKTRLAGRPAFLVESDTQHVLRHLAYLLSASFGAFLAASSTPSDEGGFFEAVGSSTRRKSGLPD